MIRKKYGTLEILEMVDVELYENAVRHSVDFRVPLSASVTVEQTDIDQLIEQEAQPAA